jgi:hypothetical protein
VKQELYVRMLYDGAVVQMDKQCLGKDLCSVDHFMDLTGLCLCTQCLHSYNMQHTPARRLELHMYNALRCVCIQHVPSFKNSYTKVHILDVSGTYYYYRSTVWSIYHIHKCHTRHTVNDVSINS